MSAAPSLDLVGATETTISVEFKPLSSVADYDLQWKEFPAKWETGMKSMKVHVQAAPKRKKIKAEATDLNPGMTYCVRLACEGKEPGPELIIDTEQVGCTPKSSCECAIL